MSVQRYTNALGRMVPVERGSWVVHTDYAALEARCAGMEATLQFYADEEMWKKYGGHSTIDLDEGRRARSALARHHHGRGAAVTKAEVIMKIAMEHLSDGHDAYCTDCGWCGFSDQIGCPYGNCPECESEATVTGAREVALQYLDEDM